MRVIELLAERSDSGALTLELDNPGGDWLKRKQKENEEDGKGPNGYPHRFGPVTAVWSRRILVPVEVLARVKGARDEQANVRDDSLSYLVKYMSDHDELPKAEHSGQYPPFITVWQDGTPWVNEGNHRIMAAKKLGWKYLPIELRYFSGGEAADGPLSPSKLKAYDSKARAEGFEPGQKFNAKGAEHQKAA